MKWLLLVPIASIAGFLFLYLTGPHATIIPTGTLTTISPTSPEINQPTPTLPVAPSPTPANPEPNQPTPSPAPIPAPTPAPKPSPAPPVSTHAEFTNPQPVAIQGYTGSAMEPFISRDGRYLFFNNDSSDPNSKLYWAKKIDDTHFQFMGEIQGVNTAENEHNVTPSMDTHGKFYFTTPRDYKQNLMSIYRGTFSNGAVTNLVPVEGISRRQPGWFNMDGEISADGNTLYYTENLPGDSGLQISTIEIAAKNPDGSFAKISNSDELMKNINNSDLNYAPDTTPDGLELFFTRVPAGSLARLYIAERSSTSEPFDAPQRIAAADGFVEGPSISPDGKRLYYHKVVPSPGGGSKPTIYMLSR